MYLHQSVNRLLEKGFSLIEFMIAIAISMIVLLAVSIAWQSGFVMQQAQTDNGRLNETVRFAIDLLSREIRQAGMINNALPAVQNFCFTNIATGSVITGINDPTKIDPTITGMSFAGTATPVLNLSDAIRVRYYGDNTGLGGTAGGNSNVSDCLGNPIKNPPANTPPTIVEDTLYVAPDTNNNNEPSLWCHTSNPNSAGAPSQPMVAGVESLQILYGDDPDGDGIVNRYLPAQLLGGNFDNVISVKVSVIARSANAVTTGSTVANTYYHFGKSYVDPGGTTGTQVCVNPPLGNTQCTAATQVVIGNDNRMRLPQPVSTEIAIRNLGNCS